jgi:hypothetical protein
VRNTGTLKVVAQGDRQIIMTRVFDAPRELVFEAFTDPQRPLLRPLPLRERACRADQRRKVG